MYSQRQIVLDQKASTAITSADAEEPISRALDTEPPPLSPVCEPTVGESAQLTSGGLPVWERVAVAAPACVANAVSPMAVKPAAMAVATSLPVGAAKTVLVFTANAVKASHSALFVATVLVTRVELNVREAVTVMVWLITSGATVVVVEVVVGPAVVVVVVVGAAVVVVVLDADAESARRAAVVVVEVVVGAAVVVVVELVAAAVVVVVVVGAT